MGAIEAKKKDDILEFGKSFGLGFYRVTLEGRFIECCPIARKIFDISPAETDLSKYSITDYYISPEERDARVFDLLENSDKPYCGTLSIRVKNEDKILFDICRYDTTYSSEGNFFGYIWEIENMSILPQMVSSFPMGFYEVDQSGKILRVNKKMLEILKYSNEELLKRNINALYEDENDLVKFTEEIKTKGFAQQKLRLKDANTEIIEVECFSKNINEYGLARWGLLIDITERERLTRLLSKLPTGVYYIENMRIKWCNVHFAQIFGYGTVKECIGKDPIDSFVDKDDGPKYLNALEEADISNRPLQNYEIRIKQANSGRQITIAVDSHLVKDINGKTIGREGTIRDVSEKKELEYKLAGAEDRMKKMTEDINKLIHTFLHPVIKFAGNASLLHQVGNILQKSMLPGLSQDFNFRESGQKLLMELSEIKDNIPDEDKESPHMCFSNEDEFARFVVTDLKKAFSQIINILDYSLKEKKSDILLDRDVRDTALRVLEELSKAEFSKRTFLRDLIKPGFIEFLEGILFTYLIRDARILVGETELMKREVEALRNYIGLKQERKYMFVKQDIGKILESNMELFKAVLAEEKITIDYEKTGDLTAEISPNDIERVICNLFHNAKKYSHRGTGRYVKVRAKEIPRGVEFFIQSYGIPIKKEEIESGKIWEFGYRGELVYAIDRDGTGVGLTDAKEIIEAHGGEIFLSSIPAVDEGNQQQYKTPYVTRVTIKLPKIARKTRG